MQSIQIHDIQKLNIILPKKLFSSNSEISGKVAEIIKNVEVNGINACIQYTKKFDKISLSEKDLFLDLSKLKQVKLTDKKFKAAVNKAILNIRTFHKNQKVRNYQINSGAGCFSGERWIPLDSAGCYVPGGSAPLISTILMTVIPAKLAGVKRIIVATPPNREGQINPYMFYVCKLLKADFILKLGGAQAIAAMAFGLTPLFMPVQKIVGPGNSWVTEAKKQIFGITDIDMLAGPSEICILADETANPSYLAADILSQVEHDREAFGTVISTSENLLNKVKQELLSQSALLERQNILEASFKNIRLISTTSLSKALIISDHIAPEHLEVVMKEENKLKNYPFKAGAVFFGNYTPVPLGDFYGGTNHVLPTNGRAAFSSPLSVYNFYRRINYIRYSRTKFLKEANHIEVLARTEQLSAHQKSISIRKPDQKGQ